MIYIIVILFQSIQIHITAYMLMIYKIHMHLVIKKVLRGINNIILLVSKLFAST